jgi:Holliday junction resolvase RusA-like endonuclease
MIKLFIPIIPMGAVRTTQRQKFVDERAKKYFTYKQQIALLVKQHINTPTGRPILADITFYMPIPMSWSLKKKERYNGAVHKSKPDIDNMIKGCFDALNKIAWKDDNQVYEVNSRKVYSFNPGIGIEIWELEEEENAEQVETETAVKKNNRSKKERSS